MIGYGVLLLAAFGFYSWGQRRSLEGQSGAMILYGLAGVCAILLVASMLANM